MGRGECLLYSGLVVTSPPGEMVSSFSSGLSSACSVCGCFGVTTPYVKRSVLGGELVLPPVFGVSPFLVASSGPVWGQSSPPPLSPPLRHIPPPPVVHTPPAVFSPPFLLVGLWLSKGRNYGGLTLMLMAGVKHVNGGPVLDSTNSLSDYYAMREIVETGNACDLPGVGIKYGPFLECMWRSVERGFVDKDKALFCAEGLKSGFMCGVDVGLMTGHRWFKNYPPAIEARHAVTAAIKERVVNKKTLVLGTWTAGLGSLVRGMFRATAIAPINAVPKPMEPEKVRPTTDHTRTGFNAATSLDFLSHSLDTYNEIAHFLKSDYFMHVSDVDSAFPMLPFHWSLWPFLLTRFFSADDTDKLTLFMHVCGDFGTRGMPGVFKIFFSDVVVNMARSEGVLTLPMPIYVDDMALIGQFKRVVLAEMQMFQAWALLVCGVVFKIIKDRVAAKRQLMIGFWWCSQSLTRTLPEIKLKQYVDMLAVMAGMKKYSLHDMQVCAGRMQRAIMTLPVGAGCLLYGLYTMMSGLKLGWHTRRSTRGVRDDLGWLRKLLTINLGRGYYSMANFTWGPDLMTDASKSSKYVGGGYLSACGMLDFFVYGRGASRKPIDYLEGDTFIVAFRRMGQYWNHLMIRCWIDNMSFKGCMDKGRSKVERLNVLVREMYALSLEHQCVISPEFVPTLENGAADFLSRPAVQLGDPIAQVTAIATEMHFWAPGTVAKVGPYAGGTRTLDEERGVLRKEVGFQRVLSAEAKTFHPSSLFLGKEQTGRVEGDGARRCWMVVIWLFLSFLPVSEASSFATTASTLVLAPPRPMPLGLSVQYQRASLFTGLDEEDTEWVMRALDNRLSASSWSTIKSGVKRWRACAQACGFSVILATDDLERGAKIARWLKHMVQENVLVYKSISNYLWGMRQWQMLQGQGDPILGVLGMDLLLESVKVLTFTVGEPHRQMPPGLLGTILEDTDEKSFEEVQFNVVLLTLAYTFSRTECPCPKTFDGFDPTNHWRVRDFDAIPILGLVCLLVRFQRIKQDPRIERPAARGDGDWSVIGSIPGSRFCILKWVNLFNRMLGPRPDKDGPMFLNKDRVRPYTYGNFSRDYTFRQKRVGLADEEITHPHGIRVRSYNDVAGTLGRPMAGAHGGWVQPEDKAASSVGNSKYDRFPLSLVIRIAACIAGTDLGDHVFHAPSEEAGSLNVPAGEIRERALASSGSGTMRRDEPLRVSAAEVQRLATEDDSSSDEEQAGPVDRGLTMPPGWSKAQRVTAVGRKYWRFTGPPDSGSRVMFSLAAAWGEFDSHQGPANEVGSDEGSVLAFANVENELARDIDNEGPSDGLGAHETVEEMSFEQAVLEPMASATFGESEGEPEPVGSPQVHFFELVKGLCGTPLCGLLDGHLGLCANQVVVSKRRDDSATRLMSPLKHVGSQIV